MYRNDHTVSLQSHGRELIRKDSAQYSPLTKYSKFKYHSKVILILRRANILTGT